MLIAYNHDRLASTCTIVRYGIDPFTRSYRRVASKAKERKESDVDVRERSNNTQHARSPRENPKYDFRRGGEADRAAGTVRGRFDEILAKANVRRAADLTSEATAWILPKGQEAGQGVAVVADRGLVGSELYVGTGEVEPKVFGGGVWSVDTTVHRSAVATCLAPCSSCFHPRDRCSRETRST